MTCHRPIEFVSKSACPRWAALTALLALVGLANPAVAQLCVQLNGAFYTQDFNTLPVSGASNNASSLPIGFAFSESGNGNNVTYAASDGSSSTANTFSYGTGTNTDRAFGELTSVLQSTLGACFVNNTGFLIPSFSIAYTGEQWRLGAADGNVDKLDFQFSTNATSLNEGTWTDVNSLDFSSPKITGVTGPLDGNLPGNRGTFSPTAIIPAGGIPAGSTFFIRWVPNNISGANDGLAIDDFKLSYAPSADFDQDSDVDGKDFIFLQRGLVKASGASITQGDANRDGAVDAIDTLFWRTQFGTTKDAPPLMAVPEPVGAGVLAAVGCALAATRRRR